MFLKTDFRKVSLVAIACIFVGSLVSGDDEPKAIAPLTAEQNAVLEADPFLKKASVTFNAEMLAAESAFLAAKQKAAEKRLGVYRDQLKAFTKAGDFEKAVACKAAIDILEAAGLDGSLPRPKDAVKFGGHTYALIKEPATWHVAKRRCEIMGGHLAYVKGAKELEFVGKLAGQNVAFLGATDEEHEGDWRWLDGSKWTPKPREADNDKGTQHVLSWDGTRKRLDDTYSCDRMPYVCEWDN